MHSPIRNEVRLQQMSETALLAERSALLGKERSTWTRGDEELFRELNLEIERHQLVRDAKSRTDKSTQHCRDIAIEDRKQTSKRSEFHEERRRGLKSSLRLFGRELSGAERADLAQFIAQVLGDQ